MTCIAVTGASGFLGKAIVAAVTEQGHEVIALTRADADLADGQGLADALAGADAVIHAAAGHGGDQAHARDTLKATENLIAALPDGARLVLVSSFSVYAFERLADGAVLDETTPTDPDGFARDAYARAKIGQEKQAIHAAQTAGLDLWIARPGAIFGPGRTTTARLGWHKFGRWFCPGGDSPIPAIHVDDCAQALVAAATVEDQGWPDDVPMQGAGHVRIVNLVHPVAPTQTEWLQAIGARAIRLPYKTMMRLATLPGIGGVIPNALRPPTLAARFKPLRFATDRLEQRLGVSFDTSFADAMAASRKDIG
ncbi:MAG: NAD(P)-dependent oxidoreductase [Pseudomonadota bacterium]